MIQYVGEEHNKGRIGAKTCAFQFNLLRVALMPSSSAYVRFQEKKTERVRIREKERRKEKWSK